MLSLFYLLSRGLSLYAEQLREAESRLVTSMDCEEGLLTEKYLEDDQ